MIHFSIGDWSHALVLFFFPVTAFSSCMSTTNWVIWDFIQSFGFVFFFFLTLKRSFYDPCARAQLEPTRISARLELLLVSWESLLCQVAISGCLAVRLRIPGGRRTATQSSVLNTWRANMRLLGKSVAKYPGKPGFVEALGNPVGVIFLHVSKAFSTVSGPNAQRTARHSHNEMDGWAIGLTGQAHRGNSERGYTSLMASQ